MSGLKAVILLSAINLALLTGLEFALRAVFDRVVVYDIEMTRYTRDLTQPATNPRIRHVQRPNARRRLMGVDVTINSDGFRDSEYSIDRSEAYRLIWLGDSLTLGWGVDFDDTFAEILERRLGEKRPVEAINFGTVNHNTEQQTQLFIESGLPYRPDHVVLFYFLNDAESTPARTEWSFLEHSELVSIFWSRARIARGRISGVQGYADYYRELYGSGAPGWKASRESLTLLRELCAREGIRLQVVLLPELHELYEYPFSAEHALVLDHLRSLGIDALDLAPRFAGERDPERLWVASDDAHPNALAHARIADYAAPFIEELIAW